MAWPPAAFRTLSSQGWARVVDESVSSGAEDAIFVNRPMPGSHHEGPGVPGELHGKPAYRAGATADQYVSPLQRAEGHRGVTGGQRWGA